MYDGKFCIGSDVKKRTCFTDSCYGIKPFNFCLIHTIKVNQFQRQIQNVPLIGQKRVPQFKQIYGWPELNDVGMPYIVLSAMATKLPNNAVAHAWLFSGQTVV